MFRIRQVDRLFQHRNESSRMHKSQSFTIPPRPDLGLLALIGRGDRIHDMAPDLFIVQFKANSYNALCRKGLPDPQHDLDQLPADEAWQYRVLACRIQVS